MSRSETVFLFPGQGSYDGGALALARDRYPKVTEVFAELDAVSEELFTKRVTEILFAGNGPDLAQLLAADPWVSQFAIYGASVAAYRVLTDAGVRPDVLMGHSLGEIAALVAAGAYSVADGARIVAHRVQAIQEVAPGPGRMVALATDVERAARIIDLVGDDRVAVATENHPNQFVLSGPQASVVRVLGIARLLEIGAMELKAPFPFHSPMLAPAVPVLADRIAALPAHPLDVPVYSPIKQGYYESETELPAQLAAQLTRPVRFTTAVAGLHESGARRFVEVGGARALTGLVRKILATEGAVSTWASLSLDGAGTLALTETLAELSEPDGAPTGGDDPIAVLRSVLAPDIDGARFAAFWARSGAEITGLVAAKLAEPAQDSTPEPAPESTPEPTPAAIDRTALATELRAQYAAALEYPEEVFTDDVRLEAELGVDSVKQVELISRAFDRYGLPERDGGIRISNYDTMAKVVDLVHGAILAHQGVRS